ncbi:NinE family protein [Enterobacter sp. 10-1]|uniref:NinE family protein n=1 Tax=Raoultella sp. 10-1 TaxID=2683201 RepID=UPI000BA4D7BE|nr:MULTISPECIES: NinE family protein [Enterobacteriaceae]MVT01301.1 NinE family protein [Raoultella sp. 10-1]PAC13856.1 NinE family protein [Enterobacter sp. 10-1]
MNRRSPTQIVLDSLIFTPTRRSRNKTKPTPTASEVKSYDPTYPLLAKRWLRVKARRRHG